MAKLWVLGAGCSRNYSQSTSKVPKLKPPLNRDFFNMVRKIVEYDPETTGRTGILGALGWNKFIEDLNAFYGDGSKTNLEILDDAKLNLEGVMNHFYLENRLLGHDYGSTANRRLSLLKELIAITLEESLRGGPCEKHAKLAQLVEEGDVIFNMNYDLLMDNALYDAGKLEDSGYLIRLDYSLVDGRWLPTPETKSDVLMFKLHGSLNWVNCTYCGRNLLLRKQKSAGPGWYDTRFQTVRCPRCNSAPLVGLERIIIPPAGVRESVDQDVKYVWSRTEYYCKNIDRVVVIGYSFAEVDAEMEMIFRQVIKEGGIPREVPITVVNTHPDPVTERLDRVFGKGPRTALKSLDAFLEQH